MISYLRYLEEERIKEMQLGDKKLELEYQIRRLQEQLELVDIALINNKSNQKTLEECCYRLGLQVPEHKSSINSLRCICSGCEKVVNCPTEHVHDGGIRLDSYTCLLKK